MKNIKQEFQFILDVMTDEAVGGDDNDNSLIMLLKTAN